MVNPSGFEEIPKFPSSFKGNVKKNFWFSKREKSISRELKKFADKVHSKTNKLLFRVKRTKHIFLARICH